MKTFRSPGRVNLIGEHTDYNGGYVLPCALNMGFTGYVTVPGDADFPDTAVPYFSSAAFGDRGSWLNYPNAVIAEFEKLGIEVPVFALKIDGNLPSGSGLSSSAALELLVATVINSLIPEEKRLQKLDLAFLCQRAEHAVGVNCGIMDQFAAAMGRENCATLLNCASMEFSYIPLNLGEYTIVVVNSNVKHSHVAGKYNDRREECFNADNPLHEKRMRHVNSENARVLAAGQALSSGDVHAFGELMNQSHISMRDDFEVTCAEIDKLVEIAQDFDGCAGSRMTGGGFGGCTVNLVKKDRVPRFIDEVGAEYKNAVGISADFYVITAADGAHEVTEV